MIFKKYFLLIIGFYFINVSSVKADIIATEREILIEFYQATKGDFWRIKANWLTEDTCSWYGITCLDNDLFKMDLSGNNLEGTLPESFANLDHLTHLNLATIISASAHSQEVIENKIQLPKNFGNLIKLNRLILNRLALIQLPESFGNLQNLNYLEMNYNKLSALPKSFGNLQNLDHLEINYNQLFALPESFGNLQTLDHLEMNNNQLSTLPESFGNLQTLSHLNMNYNKLSALPESFGNLQNLRRLKIDNNQLSHLPNNFGNLTQLFSLHLLNNKLIDLPDNFGNLTELIFLNLAINNLSYLPDSFQNLTQLIESKNRNEPLRLFSNDFVIIPRFISENLLEGNPIKKLRRQSNTLFDWAETIFYELFSSANQESKTLYIEDPNSPFFGQWYYRYYPDTKNYMAAKPNKQQDNYDIYILGGSFGNNLIFIDTLPQLFETKLSSENNIKISNIDQRKAGEEFEYQYKTLNSEGVLRVKIKEYNDKQAVIESELTLNGKITKTIETRIFENSEEKHLLKEVIIESEKETITLISSKAYSLVNTHYFRQSEKKLPTLFFSSSLTPNEQPTIFSNERLKINAVNLKITIPAGTFDIIKQTLKRSNGEQIESWIDIKTGIDVIKRISDRRGFLTSIQILKEVR